MERTAKESLIWFINEREAVRDRKAVGQPKPWSIDKTMQETYFCNIHREDDKVTKWIRERWASSTFDPVEFAPANMCLARLVNKPESLADMDWPMATFSEYRFKQAAHYRKPFWGNAYVVTTHGQPMSKVEYACGVLERVFAAKAWQSIPPTLKAYHGAIMQLEGFGSFMAAQVVADLKNTEGHPLQNAEDWHTWSSHGPGSLRGLGWLFERKITPSQYQKYIRRGWLLVKTEVPDMCMQDFQNCLCEFDKYMRVSTGAGRSKRRYNGV